MKYNFWLALNKDCFYLFFVYNLFFILIQVWLSPFSPQRCAPPHHPHLPPSILHPFGFECKLTTENKTAFFVFILLITKLHMNL